MKFNQLQNQILNEGKILSTIAFILTLLGSKVSKDEQDEFVHGILNLSPTERHETLGELSKLVAKKQVDLSKASFLMYLLTNWDMIMKDKMLVVKEIKRRIFDI